MLALIRVLYRAIRAGDDDTIGLAYWKIRERIGRVKGGALADRFWRAYPERD